MLTSEYICVIMREKKTGGMFSEREKGGNKKCVIVNIVML